MTQELILKREQDGITHLSLNRPASRNALSLDMISQLRQRIDETAGDRKCRVLVLSGQGPAFCAGGISRSDIISRLHPSINRSR